MKRIIAMFCLVLLTMGHAWADIPLVEAARDGDLEQVKTLIDSGVPVDSRGEDGYTALMWAARNGHLPVVRYLLKYGADPRATNSRGSTAYELANMFGRYEAADFIKRVARASRHSAKQQAKSRPVPPAEPMPAHRGGYGDLAFDMPPCDQAVDVLKVARNTFYRRRWERIEVMDEQTVRASLHRKRQNYEAEFRFGKDMKSGTVVFSGDNPGPQRWLSGLYKVFLKEYRRACYRY